MDATYSLHPKHFPSSIHHISITCPSPIALCVHYYKVDTARQREVTIFGCQNSATPERLHKNEVRE